MRTFLLDDDSVESAPLGAKRCPTGFTPSRAANSEATGGNEPTWWATLCVTPCWRSPLLSVVESVPVRPAIMSEKKMPMEMAVPEFWKVARMPEAAPRKRAGTLFMIDDVFGAANIPLPMPLSRDEQGEAPVREVHREQQQPDEARPEDHRARGGHAAEPKRSDSVPANGPETRKPAVSGSRKIPAHSGVWL